MGVAAPREKKYIPDSALATAISGTFSGAFGNVQANKVAVFKPVSVPLTRLV